MFIVKIKLILHESGIKEIAHGILNNAHATEAAMAPYICREFTATGVNRV